MKQTEELVIKGAIYDLRRIRSLAKEAIPIKNHILLILAIFLSFSAAQQTAGFLLRNLKIIQKTR